MRENQGRTERMSYVRTRTTARHPEYSMEKLNIILGWNQLPFEEENSTTYHQNDAGMLKRVKNVATEQFIKEIELWEFSDDTDYDMDDYNLLTKIFFLKLGKVIYNRSKLSIIEYSPQ